jgi:hypothetical protein
MPVPVRKNPTGYKERKESIMFLTLCIILYLDKKEKRSRGFSI